MILKVFNQYIPLRKLGYVVFESLFILAIVFLATMVRFKGDFYQINSWPDFFSRALIIMVVTQLCLYYFDLYDLKFFQGSIELVIRLLQSLGTSSVILAVFYYLIPDLIVGRGVLLIAVGFIALFIIAWRLFYIFMVRTGRLDHRLLIVGSGELAVKITKMIIQKQDTGFQVMGFISYDADRVGEPLVNPGIIGDHSQIQDLVQKRNIDRIIIALDDRRGKFPASELLACKMQGIPIEEGIQFFEHLTGCLQVEHLNPSFLIFGDGFRNPRFFFFLKRPIEIALALFMLFLLFPMMALISLLIKMDSPGPIFYRQKRLGKNGKPFQLIKFRSMRMDAETNGAVWAQKNDDRVTRVGRYLRISRMDEVPQIINVLKGEMSLVGPRPERPCFVEELLKVIPYYAQRLTVKPGITGWAQVRYPYGATQEDALAKLRYDLYYIKNVSILFDLLIIFETVKVVLFGKGAR